MLDGDEQCATARNRVGSRLGGRFKLTRLVDVGGMAAVYEASHRNGKRVAVKVLHRRLGVSERQRKRFLREAYIANAVRHPGVVPVYDDGLDGDDAYLVMELLEGETAAALQRRAGGMLPPDRVCEIGEALLEVLSAAHACGVVHRDIKPSNLFVESNGRLRVLDFGIARFEHVPGATVDTQAGAMLGTAAFMPQEQARGRWDEVDERSDVWAAGATLFTLLSGEFVHACDTANEQLGRAMTMPARSLASVAPELPEALVAVIDRALRFDPRERWPDAHSMRAALSALSAPNAPSPDRGLAQLPDRTTTWAPSTAAGSSAEVPAKLAPSRRLWVGFWAALLACASLAITSAGDAVISTSTGAASAQPELRLVRTGVVAPVTLRESTSAARAVLPVSAGDARVASEPARPPIAPPAVPSDRLSAASSRTPKARADRMPHAARPAAAGIDPFDWRY